MHRMATVVASLAVVVGSWACGGDDARDAGTAPTTIVAMGNPAATTTPGAGGDDLAAVPSALQFSAPLVDGTEFDARGLAGGTVVFWFWSPF
jgi:hypothetical protein